MRRVGGGNVEVIREDEGGGKGEHDGVGEDKGGGEGEDGGVGKEERGNKGEERGDGEKGDRGKGSDRGTPHDVGSNLIKHKTNTLNLLLMQGEKVVNLNQVKVINILPF